ncbi:MAG: hypothetical protein A2Y38_15575 [Spirochaetes bacterium GWB1_59_5]|nr:MAG: hypothetical protein A2Y38_15575 [Spirochaetes bacterium GWB1_59_5]
MARKPTGEPVGRPPKFATPEELSAKIEEYFDSCWEDKVTEHTDDKGACTMSTVRYQNRPYTIMGLAMHLDLSRQGLCEYAEKGQFSDIVKKAKQKVEMFVEEQLLWSKNATGAIFWLKNHAEYRDKQETEITGPGGGPLEFNDIQRSARIAALLNEAKKRAGK